MKTILQGLTVAASVAAMPAMAQQAPAGTATERVIVYGILSNSDIGQDDSKVPGEVQSFGAGQIGAQHGPTLLSALGNQTAGVSLADSQGNTMFQDLRFHGFEASPLQGVAQGVAVYQNGVRLNEAFGDTVNWEAIPATAIRRMDVWSSNPVFGLNALGGAVNLIMKNGFNWQGAEISGQGGTYGHGMGSAQYGIERGSFSLYAAAEGVTDSGWRLHSPSDLARLYADAGWRSGDSEVHLVAAAALSALGVVGPTPVELLQKASTAVYTYPQTTHNRIASLGLNDKTRLSENWQLQADIYVRTLRQRHIDGNDGDFESCSTRSSYGGDLCLEDDAFAAPAGGKTTAFRNQFVILNGANQAFAYSNAITYGTIDRTSTDTTTQGVTIQITGNQPLLGLTNYLTAGASVDHSAVGFQSNSMLGREFPDLNVALDPTVAGAGNIIHTLGNLGYAPADLGATTDYYGFYVVDALDLTDTLTLTAGLRANLADISGRDRSGAAPELTGNHAYGHMNPLVGATYKWSDALSIFGGYSQANRAPTPLELDCASRTQPCLLENSLVADPPLAQVVSHTYQAGARGTLAALLGDDSLHWSATVFQTDSDNDIIALASTIQGRGYYTNVPSTRRQGLDLTADYRGRGWSAYANYAYLDATYRFTGALASPNNPKADTNGNVLVTPGRHLPITPANLVKAGGDVVVMAGLSVGGELIYTGSQYFDGDPSNLNGKLPDYVKVNLRASYQVTPQWQLFAIVDNLFNDRSATYGTYFETDDTVGLLNPALTDARTLTLQQPITFQAGIRLGL